MLLWQLPSGNRAQSLLSTNRPRRMFRTSIPRIRGECIILRDALSRLARCTAPTLSCKAPPRWSLTGMDRYLLVMRFREKGVSLTNIRIKDTVPRGSLPTSRSTNRKINNSKNGEEAHEDNTRIRARNMAVKPQRLRGRLVNSDDYEILMAMYFNESALF